MKLEFNDKKNMTACCFEMPIDNLKKHYIDFLERNSPYYAIKEVMRDYESNRITESYKDHLLMELLDYNTQKPVPVIEVQKSAPKKKSTTKKKPAKRSKKN